MHLTELLPFLPNGTLPLFEAWLCPYHFRIVVTRPRRSKLGDFRMGTADGGPSSRLMVISNPTSLLTLTHEIAHLMTFTEHGWSVRPHSVE